MAQFSRVHNNVMSCREFQFFIYLYNGYVLIITVMPYKERKNKTTIMIDRDVKDLIDKLGRRHETYSDILRRILSEK